MACWNVDIEMTEHPVVGRYLWRGWRTVVELLRAPWTATDMMAASVGAVLILVPVGGAWPDYAITETLASAAILDWAKGSLGLIFLLRRQFGGSQGD